MLLVLALNSLTAYCQKTYFVTPGGAGAQDGSTWGNAYAGTNLQTAIDAARTYSLGNGNVEVQVWVAAGTYKPTAGSDRSIGFILRNQVAVYGGFAGGETELSSRMISLSTPSSTTLSGEIGGAGNSDNSYHVVNNSTESLTNSAILDGFVITAGNANGPGETDIIGGGMLNYNSSPTVRHCQFVGNRGNLGGGIGNLANFATCSPVLTDCGFIENTASYGAGMHNGNISGSCSPKVSRCVFRSNSATSNSGAIDNEGGSPVVTNCSFITNSAGQYGGVSINYTNQTFTNCSFSGNTASSGGVSHHTSGSTTFRNCSFWNNGGSLTFNNLGTVIANYCVFDSDVANYSGTGNMISAVSPFESATNLQLTPCSPAINAGDPTSTTTSSGLTDQAGNLRFYNDGRIDIGAFEFQGDAPTPPVISSGGETNLTVTQGAVVNLSITGCAGTVNWQGDNATSGTDPTIMVPTGSAGTVVYSATCTVGGCASGPGSATVTITPAAPGGSYDGYIYGADCGSFRGWAWDRNKPNEVVSVDIFDGMTLLGTLPAGYFRQDLLDNGKGDGKHAFHYQLPNSLKDGMPHSLSARVNGSGFYLKNAPKALICQNSPEPPVGNLPPVPPSPTVLIASLVAQENVPFSGTLVAFTDPEGSLLTYALAGLPAGLSLNANSRIISGTPTEVGTFILTYSATDGPGSTNSVSFSLTVYPAATTGVTGDFDGYLDKLDCGGIRGWVWDRKKPNTPLTVEFYTEISPGNITVLGSALANIYRQDLKDANKGNGVHAYNFTPPPGLVNGDLVKARVLGSTFVLKGSPKAFYCAKARISAEKEEDWQVTVNGNPIMGDALDVEIRGATGRFLQMQITDLNGRIVSEQRIDKADALERQRLLVNNAPTGLLLLRVRSETRAVTLKVIKP